jgi:hypothetical protein
MKRAFYLLITLLLFNACNEPETGVQYKTVRIKKQYRLKIPTYMKKTKELNDEASLQYMNGRREAYTIVIDEDKETFVGAMKLLGQYNDSISLAENYKNIQVGSFEDIVFDYKIYDENTKDFNDKPSFYAKVEGVVDNFPVTYFFRFVEGKENMYTLICWTERRRKKIFQYTFNEILNSFEEVR